PDAEVVVWKMPIYVRINGVGEDARGRHSQEGVFVDVVGIGGGDRTIVHAGDDDGDGARTVTADVVRNDIAEGIVHHFLPRQGIEGRGNPGIIGDVGAIELNAG